MKKPLKFNEEMQFAVQVGQKTQTRRPIKSLVCPYGEVGDVIELFMEDGDTSFAKAQIMQVQEQQLHHIKEAEAWLEGVQVHPKYGTYADSFQDIWSSIYGTLYGDFSWSSNPTVWVIEFDVLEIYQ